MTLRTDQLKELLVTTDTLSLIQHLILIISTFFKIVTSFKKGELKIKRIRRQKKR